MAIERILGTDTGKAAFEKADRNAVAFEAKINDLIANKADKAQPNWITATLQNGWTGTFLYRKNQLNQLEVKFNLTAGTKDPYTVILGLPTGYQPEYFFDVALMSPENAQKAYFYYNAGSATIYVSPVVALAAGQKCAGSFVVPL